MRREEILVQKRIEKGLSVAELAEILGVSARKIEKWEAGELPEAKYLLILSSTLDIPVELILQGGDGTDGVSFTGGGIVRQKNDNHAQTKGTKVARNGSPNGAGTALPVSPAIGAGPVGHNGYYLAERIFGYFVFAVFIIAIIVSSSMRLIDRASRPSELTIENYRDYIEIKVTEAGQVGYYGLFEYVVRITAKEDIVDLDLSMEVYFSDWSPKKEARSVVFNGNIKKNASMEQTITLSHAKLREGYEILSISGGIK